MKQIIFNVILIFTFCLVALAQGEQNLCPKINIKAPELIFIQTNDTFKASASFEKGSHPSTSKFNWIIIKKNEVFRINESGIIEINIKDLVKGGIVTLLAESLDEKCPASAIKSVSVIPPVGSPYIIDEYAELNWKDERHRLDAIVIEMQKFNDSELFVYLEFDKRNSQTERKNYLTKVLNHLSAVRGLEKNRITFLISESETKRIRFQPVPKEVSNNYSGCDDCLVIKAQDFEKLENLFNLKQRAKNPKN